jgi:hypothetical protein
MARTISDNYRERVSSTSGEAPVYLLEITHAQLAVPIRVVRDTVDLVSNGNLFVAFMFNVMPPDENAQEVATAKLSIDNVGREMVQWLELSGGGRGAQVRIMQVMRNAPDVIEYDQTIGLQGVTMTPTTITANLGYDDTVNAPGLTQRYQPSNTPGIF